MLRDVGKLWMHLLEQICFGGLAGIIGWMLYVFTVFPDRLNFVFNGFVATVSFVCLFTIYSIGVIRNRKFREVVAKDLVHGKKFYQIYNNSPDMIAIIRKDGYIIEDINQTAVDKLGYSKREVVGMSVLESPVILDDDRELLREKIEYAFNNPDEIVECKIRKQSKNHDFLFVSERMFVLKQTEDNHLLMMCRDITDEIMTKTAKTNSEKRYNFFTSIIPEGIACFKLSGSAAINLTGENRHEMLMVSQCIDCNKQFLDMNGYVGEMRGSSIKHILENLDRFPYAKMMQKIVDSRFRDLKFEVDESSAFGEPKWYKHRFYIEYGNGIYLWWIKSDITDRKIQETELRRRELQYHNLVENVGDMVFELDPTFVVRFVNKRVRDVTGFEDTQFIGKCILDYIVGDEIKNDIRNTFFERSSRADYSLKTKTIPMIKADGEMILLEVSTRILFSENGNPLSIYGVAHDVTHIRKREALKKIRLLEVAEGVVNQLDQVDAMLRRVPNPSKPPQSEDSKKIRIKRDKQRGSIVLETFDGDKNATR